MKSARQSYFLITQIPLFPAAFSHNGCSLLQLRNLPSTQAKLFPSSGPRRPPDVDLIAGLSIRPCFISVLQVACLTWLPRLSVWLWIIILSSCLLALLSARMWCSCFQCTHTGQKGPGEPTHNWVRPERDANTIAAVGPTLWTVYRCLKIHPFMPILVVSFLILMPRWGRSHPIGRS